MAIQAPPNNGSLSPTGMLTVDPDSPVGFDIYTRLQGGAASANSGFASLLVGGSYGFYRVNILTGKASLIGNFKERDRRHRDSAGSVVENRRVPPRHAAAFS